MGSSQYLPSFIPALLLAAFSLTIFPSHGLIIHQNLVTICSKTSNPSLCQKILVDDPRTISADLPNLSLISINLTMKQADQNIDSFSKLSKNTSDAEQKKGFEHCVEYYHEIQTNIQKAYEFSQQKIFRDNGPLEASKELVLRCGQASRINSLNIDVMNKLMILSFETSISVNQYAAAAANGPHSLNL